MVQAMQAAYQFIGGLVIVVALGVMIYSNTVQVPFVYDDVNLLELRIPNNYAEMTLREAVSWVRSLPYYTFSLNYRFSGFELGSYHLVNIVLHVAASSVVVWVIWMLSVLTQATRKWQLGSMAVSNHLMVALAGGLLFVSHPVQTEGVTYLTQRTGQLAALFYLLTIATYLLWRWQKRWWLLLFPALSFWLAIHAKETAYTIPLTLVLIELLFLARFTFNKRRSRLILIAVLLIIMGWLLFNIGAFFSELSWQEKLDEFLPRQVQPAWSNEIITRTDFILTQVVVKARYVQLLLVPIGQSIDHDVVIVRTILNLPFLIATIVLSALIAAAIWLAKRRQQLAAGGILFFFIALLPESSVYPLPEQMVEYRLYLPMFGVAMVFAAAVQWLLSRFGERRWLGVLGQTFIIGLVGIIIAAYSILAYQRNELWRDPVALWADAAAKSPQKARPLVNQSVVLISQERFDEAEEVLLAAIEAEPEYPLSYHNLGVVYKLTGDNTAAISYLEQTLEWWSYNPIALSDLGLLYMSREKYDRAIEYFHRAVEQEPSFSTAYSNLGVLYVVQGDLVAAEEQFKKSLEVNPRKVASYVNLGSIYLDQGRLEEGRALLEKALELNPKQPQARSLLRSLAK